MSQREPLTALHMRDIIPTLLGGAGMAKFRISAMSSALALLLLALVAVPAYAATIYHYVGPSGFGAQGGGYGRYDGVITYNSRHKFSYEIDVTDICPGDGLGVSYSWWLDKVGVQVHEITNVRGRDTNGCGNGSTFTFGTVERNNRDIARAALIPCWTNDGDPCYASPMQGPDNWTDNPHV